MICPERYRDVATGKTLLPRDRRADILDSPSDRLEAVLDACLVNTALAAYTSIDPLRIADAGSPILPTMQPLMRKIEKIKPRFACVFRCHLSEMRHWLGGYWTKRTIANLFREKVSQIYLDGGWGECSVECGKPSSKMIFRFDVRTKAETSLYMRGTAALADLGDILGIDRRSGRGQESTVEYLEDLRLNVSLMRFDLEMTKRENSQWKDSIADIDDNNDEDDDGYWPPFEGSPDDENFGT